MIHAFVFLVSSRRDHDDHGPIFQSHMQRINALGGTQITVFHTFHEEVDTYRVHWWQCEGVCRQKAPHFGIVKRAMNRAPGPSDFWWKDHQQTCGGTFTKIRSPDPKPKSTAKRPRKNAKLSQNVPKIDSFFDKKESKKKKKDSTSQPEDLSCISDPLPPVSTSTPSLSPQATANALLASQVISLVDEDDDHAHASNELWSSRCETTQKPTAVVVDLTLSEEET